MFETDQYQLLDFGDGRKLERFGTEILDRPSPAAETATVGDPDLWGSATARFELAKGGKGRWDNSGLRSSLDDAEWSVQHHDSRLVMALSGSGNVGIFPEQASNWDWIGDQVGRCRADEPSRPPRVLNLFAYTGGASLAAAAAGAEVTHIDSSGPTVTWAKNNAAASGMADLPIRWIVDDASKFVAREGRRGNIYDGVILDPPTYGHGPKGKSFKFHDHVDELMEMCGELLDADGPGNRFLLFSCHAPGFFTSDAETIVFNVVPDGGQVTSSRLALETADGRELRAGVCARWSSAQ